LFASIGHDGSHLVLCLPRETCYTLWLLKAGFYSFDVHSWPGLPLVTNSPVTATMCYQRKLSMESMEYGCRWCIMCWLRCDAGYCEPVLSAQDGLLPVCPQNIGFQSSCLQFSMFHHQALRLYEVSCWHHPRGSMLTRTSTACALNEGSALKVAL
jgi:hypothetical protein